MPSGKMIYRSRNEFEDALASYNEARARYDSEVQDWNAQNKQFGRFSFSGLIVCGAGLLAAVAVGVLAYNRGCAESVWGWGVIWILALWIFGSLDAKSQALQKESFIARPPSFGLEKPIYEPSYAPPEVNPGDAGQGGQGGHNGHREPPPRGTQSPLGNTFDTALSTLGLPRGATLAQVKSAYRARIREYHPDKVAHLGSELTELAERKSKEINSAYQFLSTALQPRTER